MNSREGVLVAALIPSINYIHLEKNDNLPRYHKQCHNRLYKFEPPKPSREKNSDPIVEHVMNFLETNRDECQFRLIDILSTYSGEMQGLDHICHKLIKYHNDEIIISRKRKKDAIICFRDKARDFLTNAWYEHKKDDPAEERKRIVLAAANILIEDVRSMVYDTEFYSSSSEFYDTIDEDVPETMKLLLDTICTKLRKAISPRIKENR